MDWNANGEGTDLILHRHSAAEAWGANRIRYSGSPRRQRWMMMQANACRREMHNHPAWGVRSQD
jgi:hypothetical protein